MEQGKPLKKPGAYNTDLYYQEKDEGYGDVGVDQEPDAGAVDDRSDPDFQAAPEEMADADRTAEAELREELPPDATRGAAEEAQDLKDRSTTVETVDERGEPVPVVQDDEDEENARDAGFTTAD